MPPSPPPIPKKLLIVGLSMTLLPQTFLYLLKDSKENKPEQTENTSVPVDQFVEHFAPQHLWLEGLLWTVFLSGIICLIIAFKKTIPNPEDKLYEEEWEKKGR
jgi:hypothetical protein